MRKEGTDEEERHEEGRWGMKRRESTREGRKGNRGREFDYVLIRI